MRWLVLCFGLLLAGMAAAQDSTAITPAQYTEWEDDRAPRRRGSR